MYLEPLQWLASTKAIAANKQLHLHATKQAITNLICLAIADNWNPSW